MPSDPDPFHRIYRLKRFGRYAQALDELVDNETRALRPPFDIDPNHAWYVVADIFYKLGDYERAAAGFLRALSYRDDDVQALKALANSYSELQEPKRAEHALRKAISLRPNDSELAYNLGNALFDQQQFDDAISVWTDIVTSDEELQTLVASNIDVAQQKR